MTTKRYRTIVADPPWPFRWGGQVGGRRRRATALGYETMSLEKIAALPVGELAEDDAHLYLWATDEVYREGQAVTVARAWGFEPVGPSLIWAKPNLGMGRFPRGQHEPLLVCRRGKLPFTRNDVGTVQHWRQPYTTSNGSKRHSSKPDGALDLIESASPAPYLELFARRARFGWSYWGDESLSTVELPEAAA